MAAARGSFEPLAGLWEALLKLSRLPYTVLLMTPFVFVLTRVRLGPWPFLPAPWWVSVALAGWALYAIVVAAVLVERLFLRDPVAVAQEKRALTGTVILLSPVSSAWVCCFFGLPVAQLFGYAALSFICVALWGWRYRRIIGYAG